MYMFLFPKVPPGMGSRLDPVFGGLGVGAPGRYLSGGSFFSDLSGGRGFH